MGVRARDFGQPASGDRRAVAGDVDARVGLDAEVRDAWPDILPLLANDVVQAGDGARPGTEGHRVAGEHRAAAGEVAGAHGRLECLEPLLGSRGWGGHGGIMRRRRNLSIHGMLLSMPPSRRPLRVLHTADVHLDSDGYGNPAE